MAFVDGNPMFDNAELGLNFVDSIAHPRRWLDQQNLSPTSTSINGLLFIDINPVAACLYLRQSKQVYVASTWCHQISWVSCRIINFTCKLNKYDPLYCGTKKELSPQLLIWDMLDGKGNKLNSFWCLRRVITEERGSAEK